MSEFKLVKEESYESIQGYINQLFRVADNTYPFAFVNLDDIRYMVTKVVDPYLDSENTYAITYDDGEGLKLMGTYIDDDSYAVTGEEYSYKITNDETVVIENQYNKFREQFSVLPTIESNPKLSCNYTQIDPYNRRSLHMHYLVDGFKDYHMAIPYLKNKDAQCMELVKMRFLLDRIKKCALVHDRYYNYFRLNDDAIAIIPFTGGVSVEDTYSYLQSLGFNTHVSNEIIELATGKNEKVKTLKKVTDIYKENTHL